MKGPSLLQQIRQANESFLAGTPQFLGADGDPFLLIACIDPRLTGLLEPALGLPRNRAIVIRTAGNRLSGRTPDTLRSVAAALFVKKVREIIVAGHTDCAMASFSTPRVIANFRAAGVPRTAFGEEDLRTWFDAFHDIRGNVIEGIEYLRNTGLLPTGLKVHGLVLDTTTGAAEVLVDGDTAKVSTHPALAEPQLPEEPIASEPVEEKRAPATAALEVAASSARVPPVPTIPESAGRKPIVIGRERTAPEETQPPPASLLEAITILKVFFDRERKNARLRSMVSDIGNLLKQDRDPALILFALEQAVADFRTEYPRLPAAIAYLKENTRSRGAGKAGLTEILKRVGIAAH